LVLDMTFDKSMSESALNQLINNIPGVVEHGIFYGLASSILIADNGNVTKLESNSAVFNSKDKR